MKTCIAHCIHSPYTERVYVVISSVFIREMTAWLAAQDTTLRLEDIPYPHTTPAEFERFEQVWRHLVQLTGGEHIEGMRLLPVLEKAVALLQEGA